MDPVTYEREKAIGYAHKWAFGRNPKFHDFENLGGDCTNFISQCIYAGCRVMNYTPTYGWYYISLHSRSPAWTGVPYLYNFLTANKGAGPYGHEAPLHYARPGDIVQLSFDGQAYGHSLFVVSAGAPPDANNILIATHTYDADHKRLSSYAFASHRLICIDGARK